ncbi:MAG: iron hydrogenase small subunit [Deltaproteobacteria bacterium]|nr:iron hydrogenase small subunit [Candidatus Zymogenaceae bacterium]
MKKKDKQYTYIDSPFVVSRRQFFAIGGVVTAALAVPAIWTRAAVKRRTAYIRARAKGLYLDDNNASVRVSHDNASVMQMYEKFAGHPLSEVSEELFHTTYVNRRHM